MDERQITSEMISNHVDPERLKALYITAATFTYKLHCLHRYLHRTSDVVLTTREYRLGEGALLLNGSFFIPKHIVVGYIEACLN